MCYFWCRMCTLEVRFLWLVTQTLSSLTATGRGVTYFRIGVPTDDDVNRAWRALAQDRVDIVQSHVVNHSVIDLYDLIPVSEGKKRKFKYGYCIERFSESVTLLSMFLYIRCHTEQCLFQISAEMCRCLTPHRSRPSMWATDPGEKVWM